MTALHPGEARVEHEHLSGKFSSSAELLRDQVLAAAAWADVITLTEVNYADRGQVLAEIPGFMLLRGHDGPDGESAILLRDGVWRARTWETVELVDNVPAARDRIVVILALLEHVTTGMTLLLSAGHLPASVEGSWRARTARVISHQLCVQRWRRAVRRFWRKHRPDAALVVGDWNLNLHRLWVRTWIRTAWPSMRPPDRRRTALEGDLGPRLISWAIGRRVRDLSLRVLDKDPASDHRGVRLTYLVRRRRKKEHR